MNGSSSSALLDRMECTDHSLTNAEMLKSYKITAVSQTSLWQRWKRQTIIDMYLQRKRHVHGNGILAGARPALPSHHPPRCNLSFVKPSHVVVFAGERSFFSVAYRGETFEQLAAYGKENCILLCTRNAVKKRHNSRWAKVAYDITVVFDRAVPNTLDRCNICWACI